ncbi:MAG: hypothetical protein DWQ07_19075 [Chloroflexi bacterium]|nr:MAG: hypothetical protein DWQ07_19075 [Chloroflexota bacterium]MBL1195036.1 hypothetical protein [Chloroflexota bacterium]NOH12324.1 hypothetical protein [Chloroflexota bacterium]
MQIRNEAVELYIAEKPVGRLQIDREAQLVVTVLNDAFEMELSRLRRTLLEAPVPYGSRDDRKYLYPNDEQFLSAVVLRLKNLQWQSQPLRAMLVEIQDDLE